MRKEPFTAGMTIEAKPRDKTTNNKLGALSGGEKAFNSTCTGIFNSKTFAGSILRIG